MGVVKLCLARQYYSTGEPMASEASREIDAPGACIIKLITAVIYSFRNKLECLSLNTRLDWKRLPGTNTLAYYGNHKIRP